MEPLEPTDPTDPTKSSESTNHDPEREAAIAAEAASADPDFADTAKPEHDPFAHLRPYQFKKGEPSANPHGRPPGIRTLARRMRQAGGLRPSSVAAFKNLAIKLGIDEKSQKGMDLLDLYTLSTMLHAMSGKGPAMQQVTRLLGSTIHYTPNDSASKTPDDYKRDSIKFYEAVISAPDVEMKEKILARAKLDAILGLLNEQGAMGAEELADAIRESVAMMEGTVPTEPDEPTAIDTPAPAALPPTVDEV